MNAFQFERPRVLTCAFGIVWGNSQIYQNGQYEGLIECHFLCIAGMECGDGDTSSLLHSSVANILFIFFLNRERAWYLWILGHLSLQKKSSYLGENYGLFIMLQFGSCTFYCKSRPYAMLVLSLTLYFFVSSFFPFCSLFCHYNTKSK